LLRIFWALPVRQFTVKSQTSLARKQYLSEAERIMTTPQEILDFY